MSVVRSPLSVGGVLVALGGDNVQIFEYSTDAAASDDLQKFQEKINGSRGTVSSKITHLYKKDTALIFYMGTREDILTVLNFSDNTN